MRRSSSGWGYRRASRSSTWAAATAPRPSPRRKLGCGRAGRRYREQPGRGREQAGPGAQGLRQLPASGRRCRPIGTTLPDHAFDLVASIFGGDVGSAGHLTWPRKRCARVTRPWGPRSSWATRFPTTRRWWAQILKTSSGLHAATAGRLHQPDDVGNREPRDRAVLPCAGAPAGKVLRARHLYVQLSRCTVSASG